MAQYSYNINYNGPHTWAPEEPITADLVNNMEAGIVEALNQINEGLGDYDHVRSVLQQVSEIASNARSAANSAMEATAEGHNAWLQVQPATLVETLKTQLDRAATTASIVELAAGTYKNEYGVPSIAARLNAIESTDNDQTAALTLITTELESAAQGALNNAGKPSLTANLNAIRSLISDNTGNITNINNKIGYTDEETINAASPTNIKQIINNIESIIGYTKEETINANPATNIKQIISDTATAAQTYTNTQISTVNSTISSAVSEINGDIDALEQADTTILARIDAIDSVETGVNSLANRLTTVENNYTTLTGQEGPITGLRDRVEALESEVDMTAENSRIDLALNRVGAVETTTSNLDTRLDAIDGGSAISTTNGTLNQRVTALETSTVILDEVTYDLATGNPTSINNPSTSVMYLLKKGDKYYFWKYIQTGTNTYTWALISGGGGEGGGTGNSSGIVVTAIEYANNELVPKVENTDYFVERTDGYHHYRWIPNDEVYVAPGEDPVLKEIEIGNWAQIDKSKIKRYNIYKTSEGSGTDEVVYLNLYQYDYDEDNNAIDTERPYFARVELPKGGGTSSTTVNQLIRLGNQTIETIVGSEVKLRVFFSSYDGPQKNDGNYVLKAGNTTIDSGKIYSCDNPNEAVTGWKDNTVGYKEFDVSKYCKVGTTNFTLTVTVGDTPFGKPWTVDMKDLRITSEAPDTLLINSTDSYVFNYTAFGAITRNLHVLIDNVQIANVELLSATSGRPNTFTITPAHIEQAGSAIHGAHTIKMYLTANIGGIQQSTEETNSIIRQYIWFDENNTSTPVIIASPYNNQTIDLTQYSTINIPYQIYKKDATTIDVYYYLNDEEEPFDHVTLIESNTGTLSYLASTVGNQTLTIVVDDQEVVVNLVVEEMEGVDISPVSGALIDFDPTSLSNSSANRLPTWTTSKGTYSLTASDNFNWSDDSNGGGYKVEEDGKCFVIKAGSYVDLDYAMFNDNVFDTGAEIKIIFKTKAVRNADAVWFDNTGLSLDEKTIGIQLGAHVGWLKTNKAADTSQTTSGTEYDAWVKDTAYALDSIVLYKDVIYKCIKLCEDYTLLSPESSTMSKYWEQVTVDNIPSGVTATAWASGTKYTASDGDDWTVVMINSKYYKCIKDVDDEKEIDPKTASDNWLAMGKIDTEILATNSYLYLPYSEKDKIELDININKYSSTASNNFIMSYEDGVPNKAYAYIYGTGGDGLSHSNGIRIGSPDCDVYIYHLRIYNNALTTAQILQNFIADGKDINEKIARYNRNCIYWDPTQNDGEGRYFTSPSGTATLDPIKLAEKMPNVKILMLDTPVFTVGKKNFVQNSTLRCIHAQASADYTDPVIYPSRGDADNWFFQNGFHAGQGTTSDNYGQSSRNVDFLFEVDGVHYPTKSKNMKGYEPSLNYRSSVLVGEHATKWDEDTETWVPTSIWDETEEKWVLNRDILSTEEIQTLTPIAPNVCLDWKGDECKVSLTSTSIPNNYFNLKVNVASSENVNNALFQERYNQFLNSIYKSPAYKYNNKIKNDMEFVPAVLFVRENQVDAQGRPKGHTEFNDCNWHFYSLGNIGDSKKTDYTRAYNPKDMNEFTVENSDNNTNNGQFQSGVFMYQGTTYAVETDYPVWSNTTVYAENDIIIKDGRMYQRKTDMAALDENETATWAVADWNDITPVTTKTIYYAPRTNPNPMEYLYGIDPEEWNVKMTVKGSDNKYHYVNRKHEMLETEEFDGDHSFEFRYACMGDYRDGDLINDTTGVAKAQFNTNHQVVLDFYEWLVTATDQEFAAEASHWFMPTAMEFFYAFTHYYTMMDNRAKNTFWHWAKQYISTNESNGTSYNAAVASTQEAQAAYDLASSNLDDVTEEQTPIITAADAAISEANDTLAEDPDNAEALAAKAEAEAAKATAQGLINTATTAKKNAASTLNLRILKRDELKFLYDNADCFIVNNSEAAINEGRRFDLWAYDMDTAAGIDNNGALVFPYGKEDSDYRVEGEASSGYAFNGAGSIFWRRLKNTFANDIVSVMNNVDAECFDSSNLIEQFDEFQNCFPEEIWRLDIERKYIRTFTGIDQNHPYDNAVAAGKQNPRFLTSMMQGRKKYQRRQWIRDQGIYFNSKYRLTDITRNENTIEFNIITPDDPNSLAVAPNYDLKLTPYQDMYLNVQVGNGNYQPQIRAKAGQTYTINLAENTSGTFQETRIYINGFNSISGLGNLAPMYPYSFTLSALEHLKVLDLGTDTVGYVNANFTSLPFQEGTDLPLLETLNIKNCNGVSGSLILKTANNLRTLEATGTSVTGVMLPDYTNIEVLHLPTSVTELSLHGARFLKDFTLVNNIGNIDYSGLYTLYVYDSDYSSNYIWKPSTNETTINYTKDDIIMIDNKLYQCKESHTSVTEAIKNDDTQWTNYITTNWTLLRSNVNLPVDWMSIAQAMLEKQSLRTNLQLLKLSSATVGDISTFEPIKNKKRIIEAGSGIVELTGTVNVTGVWSDVEVDEYSGKSTSVWPELTLNTTGIKETKHLVTYLNYDGTELWKDYRKSGEYFKDPVTDNDPLTNAPYISMPEHESTAEYNYYFGEFTNQGDDPDYPEPHYIKYSGWRYRNYDGTIGEPITESSIIGNDDVILIAYYPRRVARPYTVRWHGYDPEEIINSISISYGNTISPGSWPTNFVKAKKINTNSGPKFIVFKGWDTPSTRITGETDIYSLWEESPEITAINSDSEFESLTAAGLYAIASATNALRDSILSNYYGSGAINIKMGYDPEYSSEKIETINLLHNLPGGAQSELQLTGNAQNSKVLTDFTPLSDLNNSWTIALDFKFVMDAAIWSYNTTEFVLFSCFSSTLSTRNGLRLSVVRGSNSDTSGNVVIYWGNDSKVIDSVTAGSSYNSYRNMIVLRHDGSRPNTLYVYTQSNYTNPQYYNISNQDIVESILTWTTTTPVTNPIIFGGTYATGRTDIDTDERRPAKGMIYYAKLWNNDLGVRDCKLLAAWPHETIKFMINGYNNGEEASSSNNKLLFGNSTYPLKINLSAITPLGDRYYNSSSSNNSNTDWLDQSSLQSGWHETVLQRYCSTIIYNAFPVAYQSLIAYSPLRIKYIQHKSTNANMDEITIDSQTLPYKVYLPTYEELYYNSTTPMNSNYDEVNHAWPTISPRNVSNLYEYREGYLYPISSQENTNEEPRKWRFFGKAISNNSRIFKISDNPMNPNLHLQINGESSEIVLASGDIWWNATTNQAYMYVTSAEIARGAFVDSSLSIGNAGGWSPAVVYGTRTYYMSNETYYQQRHNALAFCFVDSTGKLYTNQERDINNTSFNARAILPQFSI